MTVQYKAQARARIGGAGSGSLNIVDNGPTKTILTGYIIVATVRFQAIDDSVPGNHPLFKGKSRTSDPKSELEINWKTKPETRKRITNFVIEIFILLCFVIVEKYFAIQS